MSKFFTSLGLILLFIGVFFTIFGGATTLSTQTFVIAFGILILSEVSENKEKV